MNRKLRSVLCVVGLMVLNWSSSDAAVAPMRLEMMILEADYIVLGKVVGIEKIKDVPVAEVFVIRNYKGCSFERVFYLAEGTWTCDITKAIPEETALFFFKPYKFDPNPAPPPEDDVFVFSSEFKEPIGFKEELLKFIDSAPFLRVYFSGRGRMPLRRIQEEDYVTIWTSGVILPRHIRTIDGPDPRYTEIIRSVSLPKLTAYIEEIIQRKQPKKSEIQIQKQ